MRLRYALLAAALLVSGALPATAAAAPAAIGLPELIDAVTYAQGHALWAEHRPDGSIVVRRSAPGEPPGVVATLPGPKDDVSVTLAANDRGYLLTLRSTHVERVVRGGYDGSVSTLLDCAPAAAAPQDAPVLEAVASRDGFAFAGARCGGAPGVSLVAPDGTVTALGGVEVGRNYGLAYADPYVAVANPDAVRVIDRSTGAQRSLPSAYVGEGMTVALLADGTLITGPPYQASGVAAGIHAWAPGAASPRLLNRHGLPAVMYAAGDELFFDDASDLELVSLRGGPLRSVGAPGAGLARNPLAFDGTRAAFMSVSCDGHPQVTVVDVTAARSRDDIDGCPLRLVSRSVSTGRSGRGALGLICRNGCKADVEFAHGSRICFDDCPTTARAPLLATARVRLAPSPGVQFVTVRRTRAGRRAGRTRVNVTLENADALDFLGAHTLTLG